MITHLFNAMLPFHHRDPGIVGLVGSINDNIPAPYFGIIADGIHVHPSSIRMAYLAHPNGAILVTDAISAAEADKNENFSTSSTTQQIFTLGTKRVLRKSNTTVVLADTENTLAGSVATMPECVKNFMKFTSCSLTEAIYAASTAPAIALGLEGVKGSLREGADADFLVLEFEDDETYSSNSREINFIISRVFISGEELCMLS